MRICENHTTDCFSRESEIVALSKEIPELEKETEKKINLEMKLIDKDIAKQKEILKKMEEDFHRKIAVLTGSTVTEEDSTPDLTIDMDINEVNKEYEKIINSKGVKDAAETFSVFNFILQ
jgi:thymidylate synthase ThyX